MTAVSILVTLLILPVLYNLIFPLKPPKLDNYFQSGQVIESTLEGVKQTIIRQTGDRDQALNNGRFSSRYDYYK